MVPYYGVGVGLRRPYYQKFENDPPEIVKWVEVIAENFTKLRDGRKKSQWRDRLLRVKERFPVVLHSVTLSLGSHSKLDRNFLLRLKELVDLIDSPWVSDHICFTGVHQIHLHDLYPLPYTKESQKVLKEKIHQVQDVLEKPFLLENVSSYITFPESQMEEWDFVSELVEQADCGLLLDLNNVYVSAKNHNFAPSVYLEALPHGRVCQIHIAGHLNNGQIRIDTHGEPVCEEVWQLLKDYYKKYGPRNTMIERDQNLPEWEEIEKDLLRIERYLGAHI